MFARWVPVAHYFAWDAIRAIDYLDARDDVDSDRIGVTGLSGGGAQTAYVSALDDRVKASAPTCWIVSIRRLLASDGPQDAEQNIYYNAVLCGRSVVGIQAGDIVRLVRFLQTRDDVRKDSICAVGIEEMGPSVLYAAAFEPAINSIVLIGAPVSYASMVLNRYYEFGTNSMLGGALTAYDLPDLIASLAPRKVALVNLSDQMKQPASGELLEQSLAFPRSAYAMRQAADKIQILTSGDERSLAEMLSWCLRP